MVLSFGEKAVGKTFNPSSNPNVDTLKGFASMFIDFCNDARLKTENPEVKRMFSVAITECQTAQMWAVKAFTWSDE